MQAILSFSFDIDCNNSRNSARNAAEEYFEGEFPVGGKAHRYRAENQKRENHRQYAVDGSLYKPPLSPYEDERAQSYREYLEYLIYGLDRAERQIKKLDDNCKNKRKGKRYYDCRQHRFEYLKYIFAHKKPPL